MKKFLIILFCLLLLTPSIAQSAITEAASQRATTAGTTGEDSRNLAFPNNVTSGSLLIVAGSTGSATPASITVTDSVSTSYTVLSATIGGVYRFFIAYGKAPSSGANTVTVNPDGASSKISFSIDEFTGQDATTPLDVDGGSATGTGIDPTPTKDITTVAANALVVGVVAHTDTASHTITPNASFTQIGENENGGTAIPFNAEFRIVTTATTYTTNWTITSGTSINWGMYVASFKPAVAGAKPRRQVIVVD